MIVFKLVDRAGLSYSKEHSFGDKSRPADFVALHVGFVRIIRPIKEEAFSKYFKMYLGDDYEWHHKVRKEVKKQRSKLSAFYDKRNGEILRDKQKQITSMHRQILGLKEDIRSLVRSAEVIDRQHPNTTDNTLTKKRSSGLNKNINSLDKNTDKPAIDKSIVNRIDGMVNTTKAID